MIQPQNQVYKNIHKTRCHDVIGVFFFLTDATIGAVPLDNRKRRNTSGSQGKRSRVRKHYSTADTNEGEHCLSVLKQLRIFVCALQIY